MKEQFNIIHDLYNEYYDNLENSDFNTELRNHLTKWFEENFNNSPTEKNEKSLEHYKSVFKFLAFDLIELIYEYHIDYNSYQLDLIKLCWDSGVHLEQYYQIDEMTKGLYKKSISYQILFMLCVSDKLGKLENIEGKHYESLIRSLEKIHLERMKGINFQNIVTEKEILSTKIKVAKSKLQSEGMKITLTALSETLKYKRVSTLQSQLNKYKIKWREL